MTMKTIPPGKFKAQCLAILDRLGPEGVVVTKHGKPVATVRPIDRGAGALIGALRGKVKVHGDILSTDVEWNTGD